MTISNSPRALSFATLALLFVFSACEPAADISSPQKYAKDGLSFTYPGNWNITEDSVEDEVRTLFVETPGDAIFIVQVFAATDAVDTETLARTYSDEITAALPIGKASPGVFKPLQHKYKDGRVLDGVQENQMMEFLGEKVPHTRAYFQVTSQTRSAMLLCQVATEDLAKARPGCDQIIESFKLD